MTNTATLTPVMRTALLQWATDGYSDGTTRQGTYLALRARGLVELEFGQGSRGPLGGRPTYGVTAVRLTAHGRAVAAALTVD